MTETTVGREPIQIVEIRQPFCARTYGVAPCTASGAAARKCFNTLSTCQDEANYLAGTPLSLFFSKGGVAAQVVVGAPYIIPSLISVSTFPTTINLAAADANSQGLGNRAVCTITFQDHTHTDRVVDPYIDGRGYNGLTRGTFWTKWMARNKYRQNIEIVLYEGYAGQTLAEMSQKLYFFESLQGPGPDGQITITGKDVLARLEARKAQAPLASPGVLYTDITAVQTSFRVAGALITDYPATGTLRIDNEIMTYTGRTAAGDQLEFTGVVRATDDSIAAAHTVDAPVQLCLRISSQRIDSTLQLLLETYGGVHAEFLDLTGWQTEIDAFLGFWLLDRLITSPTPVIDLVGQLQEQCLVNCWWDEKTAKVKLRAIHGASEAPRVLTAEGHILADTFSLNEQPAERVSQVWIYYRQRDKTKGPEDETNYKELTVLANPVEEARYDELSVRKIFATFLSSGVLAENVAEKIMLRYVNIPSTCQFRLDAKDRSIWVGDIVQISHPNDVDEFGERRVRTWFIISAEEVEAGETVEYVAADTTPYGQVFYIMPDGSADYPGAGPTEYGAAYIGDDYGKLSDGTDCARIS